MHSPQNTRKHGRKSWREPTRAACQLSRTCARARRPTSAPTKIARNASATPSRASPSAPGSGSLTSSMMRRSQAQTPSRHRAGFAALLDRIEGNGVRTVLVEDASRFARELMAQELGITLLISRGVRLLTASGDDLTASDDPTRKMMRHPDRRCLRRIREGPSGLQAAPRPRARPQGERKV